MTATYILSAAHDPHASHRRRRRMEALTGLRFVDAARFQLANPEILRAHA